MEPAGRPTYALLAGGVALVLLGAGIATVCLNRERAPAPVSSSSFTESAPPAESVPASMSIQAGFPEPDSLLDPELPVSSGPEPAADAGPPVLAENLPPLPAPPPPSETAGEAASSVPADGDIGEEGAKAIALLRAGLNDDQVVWSDTGTGWEHGRRAYELEFWYGQLEYEYDIGAADGMILKEKWEHHAPPAASGDIGPAAAKAVAFAHAGITENQITSLHAEREQEDGRVEYELEFRAGRMKYEYTLNGDGLIFECGWELP